MTSSLRKSSKPSRPSSRSAHASTPIGIGRKVLLGAVCMLLLCGTFGLGGVANSATLRPENPTFGTLNVALGSLSPTKKLTPNWTTAQVVLASWYGPNFYNKQTANGEKYDGLRMTAAHKYLPFGTLVEVCLDRCALVRINDRGPYVSGRRLDLSITAAKVIGLYPRGVAPVSVRVVGVPERAVWPPSLPELDSLGLWRYYCALGDFELCVGLTPPGASK